MTETLKEKLQKVLAIAREGEAGERNAAKSLLEKILKENGLTVEDIEDDSASVHWFKTGKSKQAKELLFQIFFSVLNTDTADYLTNPLHKGEIGLETTRVQAAEIESKFSVYAPALKKELSLAEKATMQAFFWKNNLMGKSTDKEHRDTPLSQEDIELLHRIVRAGMDMETVQIHKQIPSDNSEA